MERALQTDGSGCLRREGGATVVQGCCEAGEGEQVPSPPVYRLELQYAGCGLHGWSSQPDLPTVRGAVEEAFRTVLGGVPRLVVAGRTDTGVHARRQVVSVHAPPEPTGTKVDKLFDPRAESLPDTTSLLRSLNALTPPQVLLYAFEAAAPGFDARRQALSRRYRYFVSSQEGVGPLLAEYVWRLPSLPDLDSLRRQAALLPGLHDFSAFTPTKSEHRHFGRVVRAARWERRGELVWFDIEAESFLRHMVRTLVGTMIEGSRRHAPESSFERLLCGAPRSEAGVTAPARGLFFWDIRYPDAYSTDARPPLLALPS